ncbi:MAG: TonB-dependent receptor, partial [Deltaproteobacteria bacterium]|nr:TonB-dependent receptor [Deltaproteobacteria bacterium]
AFLLSHPYYQPNLQLASQAIINPARIDPAAQAYIANHLLPVSPTGILTPNASATDNRDEFTGKIDLHISSSDTLSLTLVRFHNPQLAPFGGTLTNLSGSTVPGYASTNTYDDYFGNLAYTKVINPAFVNDFHFTAQRQLTVIGKPVAQLPGPHELGMKITPDAVTGPPQAAFNSSGFIIGEPSTYGSYADTTYVYADSATWIRGTHTLKFGGQLGFVQNNARFIFEPQGFYDFYGATGIGSGNDLADFLLGVPGDFNQWPEGFSGARSRQWAGYALDEWKVRPNFTLTLGGRYEYSSPKHDVRPRNYYLEPGLQSVKYPLAPEGILFPGDPGTPSGNAYNFPDRTNWAPRVGFAWDPSGKGKASVRGGFGMFYDVLLARDSIEENGTSPLLNQTFISFSPSEIPANGPSMLFDDPYGSTGTINGFPSHPLSPNTNFATAGLLPLGPGSVFVDTHQRAPYNFQWNLTVQRALGNGMAMEVGYIGSTSRRLYGAQELDPFILGTTTRVLNTQPGLQDPNAYAQTPYTNGNYWGNSNYNGLAASVTKRLGTWRSIGQTFFTLSYTWSHNLDDDDGRFGSQNSYYNNKQFYGPANIDVRNRFVLSGGWELPFTRLWSSGPKRLTSGWSLYSIVTAQSGFPVDVTVGLFQDGVTPGPSGDGDQHNVRPYWSGGPVTYENPSQVQSFIVNGQTITGHFFFNPSGFTIPACFASSAPPGTPGGCAAVTYGGMQRNSFRGPGLSNFDISLEKETKLIAERVQLLFRAEFFNVLNHTEWQPNASYVVNSSLVGQITSTYAPRIGQLALKIVF